MTYDAINPLTGLPKEYANSAEWQREVDAATTKPVEEQREVKTFADASDRIRDELGLDTRTPAEIKAAADNEYVEERIAEGVSEALERQQAAQQAQQAVQAGKANQSPFAFNISHAAQPKYKFYDSQEGCGCKGRT